MNEQNSPRRAGDLDQSGVVLNLIDVGGRRLALNRAGHGSPTVILETGLGAESSEWAAVQAAISDIACVCRFDRAGRGASDPVATSRSALDMVDDLDALLLAAAIPGPYLLVGHSFGGLLMRLFAHRHGRDVAGLVLVDSMHEDQFDIFGPTFPLPTPADPPALRETRAFWQGGWKNPESTVERIDLVASIRQGREVASLGNLPVHVMIAGTFLNQPLIPPEQRPALQDSWQATQERFLNLSSNAAKTLVPGSGHFLQRDDPRAVCEAIKAMIEQVKAHTGERTFGRSQ